MAKKRISTSTLTLYDAAKLYLVYLKALKLPYTRYAAYVRGVRHVLQFYSYRFPLREFSGRRYVQYLDIYDPFDDDRVYRERGQVYLKFIFFLKKNKMIPAFTAPEQ